MGTFWTGLRSKDSIPKIRVVPPLLEQKKRDALFSHLNLIHNSCVLFS